MLNRFNRCNVFYLITSAFACAQILYVPYTTVGETVLALGKFTKDLLNHVHDMEDRLIHFYTRHRWRFLVAFMLALSNWVIGTLELYATLFFLGHPVTFSEAWIIEAIVQLVRSSAFFIPGALGVQEGAFLIVIGTMTGQGVLGLAVAMIRRFREIVWIAWGMLLGGISSLSSLISGDVLSSVTGTSTSQSTGQRT